MGGELERRIGTAMSTVRAMNRGLSWKEQDAMIQCNGGANDDVWV